MQQNTDVVKYDNVILPFDGKSITVPQEAVEAIQSTFLHANYVIPETDQLYRLDTRHGRYYAKLVDGVIKYHGSVTTIIDKYLPEGEGLKRWRADLGNDESACILWESAHYGTFVHILFGDLLLGGDVDLSFVGLTLRIRDYLDQESIDVKEINIDTWRKKSKQDVIGFIRWAKDYCVEPIGVELTLKSKKGYAGSIDLVAKGRWDKKSKRKSLAIIDFKSGRSAFYESHEIQLEAYRIMWNENYPKKRVKRIFNYGCKDFRIPIGKTVIPYRFKEQTDAKSLWKWAEFLKMWNRENPNPAPAKSYEISDCVVTLDTDISEIIVEHDPASFLKESLGVQEVLS